jgi:hypothetical protein
MKTKLSPYIAKKLCVYVILMILLLGGNLAFGIQSGPYINKTIVSSDVANQPATFQTQVTSTDGLSGYVFGSNNTGKWQNTTWTDPWTGTPSNGWANVTETLNPTVGIVVSFRFWINDTKNQWTTLAGLWIRTTSLISTHLPPNSVLANIFPFQRKSFTVNGTIFYYWINGTNTKDSLVYSYSTDSGQKWQKEQTIVNGLHNAGLFTLDYDGTYVHYAYINRDRTLKYRRGKPFDNGTIIYSAPEQTVLNEPDCSYVFPTIRVNETGFPWIGCKRADATTQLPYVIKSQWNNGSWLTASGFPYCLNETSHTYWTVEPVPLETIAEMYVVYGHDDEAWLGKSYDGNSWSSLEKIGSTPIECNTRHSIESYGDNMALVYHGLPNSTGTQYRYIYVSRNNSGIWSSEQTFAYGYDTLSSPAIQVKNNVEYVFWAENETLYLVSRNTGNWQERVSVIQHQAVAGTLNGNFISIENLKGFGIIYTTAFPDKLVFSYMQGQTPIPSIIAVICRAYDTLPGDAKWDSRADLNCDLKVDGKDLGIAAKNYGKT